MLPQPGLCHPGLVIFDDTMFVATGNGGFDPANDQYGDSVLHLSLPDLVVSQALCRILTLDKHSDTACKSDILMFRAPCHGAAHSEPSWLPGITAKPLRGRCRGVSLNMAAHTDLTWRGHPCCATMQI